VCFPIFFYECGLERYLEIGSIRRLGIAGASQFTYTFKLYGFAYISIIIKQAFCQNLGVLSAIVLV
jgi:hypothetical protein